MKQKQIAQDINLDNRIECIAKIYAFVTSRDHKQNLLSGTPCRLINPCKSELGKISKITLENINKTLIEKLSVNQWKNRETVIHWFKSIEQKSRCFFFQFNVIEIYLSITEKVLEEVIVFANQHTEMAEKDLRICPLSRRWSMEKERIRELLSRYDGKQRRCGNLWTYWNLYFHSFQIFYHKKNLNLKMRPIWKL